VIYSKFLGGVVGIPIGSNFNNLQTALSVGGQPIEYAQHATTALVY